MEKRKSAKLKETYRAIKPEIEEKLKQFRKTWESKDEKRIFKELLFCLLTPQSKAENAWEIIENLDRNNLLLEAEEDILREKLKRVRFRNNKAKYLKNAQAMLVRNGRITILDELKKQKNPLEIRQWLVNNVKGMGYKEASHFLRNIGLGEELTILDRHILKSLLELGVIDSIPKSLSKKNYLETEVRMKALAEEVGIPVAHLDFVLWQIRTERIFK